MVAHQEKRDIMNINQQIYCVRLFLEKYADNDTSLGIPFRVAANRFNNIAAEYERLEEENKKLKELLEKACIQ